MGYPRYRVTQDYSRGVDSAVFHVKPSGRWEPVERRHFGVQRGDKQLPGQLDHHGNQPFEVGFVELCGRVVHK